MSQLPIVENAVTNATYYYDVVKNYNSLLRFSCTVAEYSCQIGLSIAKPAVMYIAEKQSKLWIHSNQLFNLFKLFIKKNSHKNW